jgi:hypothetical protein
MPKRIIRPAHKRFLTTKHSGRILLPPVLDPDMRAKLEKILEESLDEAEFCIAVLDNYDADADLEPDVDEEDGSAETDTRPEYHPNVVTFAPRQA